MKALKALLAAELARRTRTFVADTVKGFKERQEARK